MKLLDIISILVVLANLSLGFFVWWKGKTKKANVWFFMLMIASSGWVLFNWLDGVIKNYSSAVFNLKILFLFPVLIVLFFNLFAIHFPKKLNIRTVFVVILVIVSIFFLVISLTDLVAKDVIIKFGVPINDIQYGSLYDIYGIYLLLYFFVGFYLLFRQLKNANGIDRIKIKLLITSLIIAAIFGLFTNLIYPMLFTRGVESNKTIISPYGPLATIFIAVLMTYAILRYRFMDIKIVIRKGIVHFFSIAIVLFLYIYLLFFTQKYFIDQYHWNTQTTLVVLVLFIALTIEPLRRLLVKLIDTVFYSQKKKARDEAKKLRLLLSSSMQFEQLVTQAKDGLSSVLEVTRVEFIWYNKRSGNLENYFQNDRPVNLKQSDPLFQYLREHGEPLVTEEIPYMLEGFPEGEKEILMEIEQRLKGLDAALVWPIGERGELIGAFLFGQKKKKEAFTSDTVEYLSEMQFSMTNAIANALLYKQAVERIANIKR